VNQVPSAAQSAVKKERLDQEEKEATGKRESERSLERSRVEGRISPSRLSKQKHQKIGIQIEEEKNRIGT